MAPLRSAIISGMNFIFLSLSRPAGRDKLIFTQRPKRIAPFEIECYSCPSLFQIVFLSKMEYNETMNILPRLRLRYGRNLI